ncbi:MAG: hypothetical protein ACJAZ2_001982, partial [Glaciecola sp.]
MRINLKKERVAITVMLGIGLFLNISVLGQDSTGVVSNEVGDSLVSA